MVEETKQANGAEKPQPAHKYVDGVFVDLEIFDDYVLICGHRMERRREWQVPVDEWRMQWEFMRKKLAKRGPMKTANVHSDDMASFSKMLQSEVDEDMSAYRERMRKIKG